ncbi:hypothetical protein U0070_011995 [Myodes glareolus]|uniref:Vomeronasal type-1 receptor n=1 Tax=Myodes glareolus TaxID=447135 RepID=A0AAW0HRC1_MYOGA
MPEHRPRTTDLFIGLLALIHLGMLMIMGFTAADTFACLMALSNGYMLILLCRHKRQVQHLHSTSLSPKASPEQRASRTILLLLSFFVLIYCLDCIISASRLMHSSHPTHHSVQMMVSNSYATISPLLLICTEHRITNFLKSFVRGHSKCLIIEAKKSAVVFAKG